jgi:hypothetical protein
VTLAECCFDTGGIGADVAMAAVRCDDADADSVAATLFGESASRVIVSVRQSGCRPCSTPPAGRCARDAHRPHRGRTIKMAVDGTTVIETSVGEAEARWSNALASWFEDRARNDAWTSSEKSAASSAFTATREPPI